MPALQKTAGLQHSLGEVDVSQPISIDEQMKCVQREIRMRENVYPKWVAAGKMSPAKAESELAMMKAVLETLKAKWLTEPKAPKAQQELAI